MQPLQAVNITPVCELVNRYPYMGSCQGVAMKDGQLAIARVSCNNGPRNISYTKLGTENTRNYCYFAHDWEVPRMQMGAIGCLFTTTREDDKVVLGVLNRHGAQVVETEYDLKPMISLDQSAGVTFGVYNRMTKLQFWDLEGLRPVSQTLKENISQKSIALVPRLTYKLAVTILSDGKAPSLIELWDSRIPLLKAQSIVTEFPNPIHTLGLVETATGPRFATRSHETIDFREIFGNRFGQVTESLEVPAPKDDICPVLLSGSGTILTTVTKEMVKTGQPQRPCAFKATIRTYDCTQGVSPQLKPKLTVALPFSASCQEEKVSCDKEAVALDLDGEVQVFQMSKLP